MGVTLREKRLKGGKGVSFYLDIIHGGKRWTQFTKIHAPAARRSEEFREKKRLAEKIKQQVTYELTVEGKNLKSDFCGDEDFLAFMMEHSRHLKRMNNVLHAAQLLKRYTGREQVPLKLFTKEFIMTFHAWMKADKKYSPVTVFSVATLVSGYLNRAVEFGKLPYNPCNRIPKAMRVKCPAPRPQYLTIDQIETLMDASSGIPEQLQQAFLFSCFSGLRWSDCSRLTWSQFFSEKIDGQQIQVLELTQQKTEQRIYVPLSAQAAELIAERRENEDSEHRKALSAGIKPLAKSGYVFPELAEPNQARLKYSRACRFIRIWGKQAGLPHVHFHIARHTFVTMAHANGADLFTVSKLLGHTSIKHTMIYANVVYKTKINAVAALPKLRSLSERMAS